MKHIKKFENKEILNNNKKLSNSFLKFIHEYFSENVSFIDAYNYSKSFEHEYDDGDEFHYIFDEIYNDKSDKDTALQTIIKYMNDIGWYDENLLFKPIKYKNNLCIALSLFHSFDEIETILIKNDSKKYNL